MVVLYTEFNSRSNSDTSKVGNRTKWGFYQKYRVFDRILLVYPADIHF
jgi:hypothetical protein